jgi:hypothetical protein
VKKNPYEHPPFACVLCDRDIAARRSHIILTPVSSLLNADPDARRAEAAAIVCARCRELPDAHARLYRDCAAGDDCDLYDHSHTLAADRTSAVAWLTQHDRITSDSTDRRHEEKKL